MIVTKKFSFDLDTRGISPLMYAVQGEVNTRKVEISLFSNGTAWEIPDGTVVAVAYRKPDGTNGLYDKLPNGESASAVSGNVVTVMLAPQVLTCAGKVMASIIFYSKDMVNTLATFPFQIHVEKNPGAGEQISNNYYYLQNLDQVNTELQGILVGYDGTIYASAGEAVRAQIRQAMESTGSGGISSTAAALLVSILKNAVYTSNQSANIAALEAALAFGGSDTGGDSGETVTYTITNNMTNCTNGNSATRVKHGSTYTAIINPKDGYEIKSVSVTMGGEPVTVVNSKMITIMSVTGNIVITAVATAATTETVEEALNPVLFNNPDDNTKTYPSLNTFEYEVLEGDAATLYKSGVLFEAPEITGGTLVLDFDATRISGFRFMVWLLNTDNTAYKILVGLKENGDDMGINDTAIGDINYKMLDPGSNPIWTYAGGEVRFAIPDGKKPLVTCMCNGSYTTILDESLMIGGSTTKMYGVINAVVAGEVITAKVVKEV